jgi:hypothetical protein
MATRRQGKRRVKKTRKQRGGKTVVKGTLGSNPHALNQRDKNIFKAFKDPRKALYTGYELEINAVKTPRQFLQTYANQALTNMSSVTKNVPNWFIAGKGLPGIKPKTKGEWDANVTLDPKSPYVFRYAPIIEEEPFIENKDLIDTVFNSVNKQFGTAKVIFASSATGPEAKGEPGRYSRNVNQNFKFHMPPQSPVILIDPGFFRDDLSHYYDFFHYLKFDVLIPEEYGGKVRIYTKQEGKTFEILGDKPPVHSIEDQKEYLAEVLEQAERANFDENSLLVIVCVQAGVNFNHEEKGWFYDLVRKYGFNVYSYGE